MLLVHLLWKLKLVAMRRDVLHLLLAWHLIARHLLPGLDDAHIHILLVSGGNLLLLML